MFGISVLDTLLMQTNTLIVLLHVHEVARVTSVRSDAEAMI